MLLQSGKMNNIFYFKKICKIGGTEQFLYEIAKKYHNYDITVYFDEIDPKQLIRLSKYIRCCKRKPGEIIKCKKAFVNFNDEITGQLDAEEIIFISHAIYQEIGYKPPIDNPKFTDYYGVSKYAARKLDEFAKKFLNKDIHTKYNYNPLTLEPKEKVLTLVSATRLDDKTKGGQRTLTLIKALDRYAEHNNKHYIWHIFTNPTNIEITSPNVALMKPRIDVRPYIANADWCIQLSNDMETYCYTIAEALGYGVPVVTTPLTVMNELPITNDMKVVCNWDMSNVDEVAKEIFERKVQPFKYEIPEDNWSNMLYPGESTYKEDKMKVKLRCIKSYTDIQLGKELELGYEWVVDKDRAKALLNNPNNLVEVVEYIEEPELEKAVKPKRKVTKR